MLPTFARENIARRGKICLALGDAMLTPTPIF
jgi:hypothetical protein